MGYQRTLAQKIFFSGEGIFTGKEIKVEIHPLEENQGIIFERADLPSKPKLKLSIEKVFAIEGSILIREGKHSIYLIEHLLSALHGLGIDNALIKVYGKEIPLLDGSALPIVKAIQLAGYTLLPAFKKYYFLKKDFFRSNGTGDLTFKPSRKLKIFSRISFDHPLIGEQSIEFTLTPQNYLQEIAFARTFGHKETLEEQIKKGIIKGGNLSNAIIIDKEGILNKEGLRSRDEFVRHKVLDIIGDLFALGLPLLAEVKANCSGHKLHIDSLKTLLNSGLLEITEKRPPTFLCIVNRSKILPL